MRRLHCVVAARPCNITLIAGINSSDSFGASHAEYSSPAAFSYYYNFLFPAFIFGPPGRSQRSGKQEKAWNGKTVQGAALHPVANKLGGGHEAAVLV